MIRKVTSLLKKKYRITQRMIGHLLMSQNDKMRDCDANSIASHALMNNHIGKP